MWKWKSEREKVKEEEIVRDRERKELGEKKKVP